MNPKQVYYQNLANTLIPQFAKRNMEACYCATAAEAKELVLSLIPKGSTVTNGGSMTLEETGILPALQTDDYAYVPRLKSDDKKAVQAQFARQAQCDYFLMSTNAFTADGELVNIDGNANRLSLLLHGPEHVIIVAGMNKYAKTREEALDRVHNVASPPNCVRLSRKTPCSVTGQCGDCHSPDCICCQEVITRHSLVPGRIRIVLVGEELGY
ncbi:MAG: lactate utilization protein [Eubacterium sp.]|nr:lactate utilization protein [Eubacterium sp.]